MHIFNLRIHKYNSPEFEAHIILLLCSVFTCGGGGGGVGVGFLAQ